MQLASNNQSVNDAKWDIMPVCLSEQPSVFAPGQGSLTPWLLVVKQEQEYH
jgi:hypothetical protein